VPPRLPIEFYPARARRALFLPVPIAFMAVPWIAGDRFTVALSAIWVLLSGIAFAFSLVGLVAFRASLVLDSSGILYRTRSLPRIEWGDIRGIRLLPPRSRWLGPMRGDVLSVFDRPGGIVALTLADTGKYRLPASPDGTVLLEIDCTGVHADAARVASLISQLSGVSVG